MQIWDGVIDVDQIPQIPPPKKRDIWIMRGLVAVGLVALLYFVLWFFEGGHIGHPLLFWPLAVAIGFKILRSVHEWYHYVGVSVPERPEMTRDWTVDMFTTYVPGEPYEMIEETLRAMVAVRYPHTTYLADEGNDPHLRDLCEKLGVVHVYRGPDKTNAKAGNINFALKQATGEIAVILDPDHKPAREFLDRVLPYFEQEDIGYVQSVQAYYNRDESFIAKGAAEQTYTFYGPMMMSMNRYGTVQAIGANCAFRRTALDSIGGHAAGLSEDMHTAMQLHAKGWKSIYVPEALTRGQVPATLSAYYKQQLKWTRGSLDLLFHTVPKLLKNFTFRQVIHYLTLPLYFLFGLVALIDLSIPIISLFTSEVPWLVEMDELLIHALPFLVLVLIIRQFAQRWMLESHERGMHFLGGTLMLGSWWVFLIGFIYTIFNIKVPYIPTPKNDEARNEWRLSVPNLAVMLISLLAIFVGLSRDWSPYMLIMAGFALTNTVMLGLVVLMAQQKMIMGFYRWLYGATSGGRIRVWYKMFRQRFIYQPLRSAYLALGVVAMIGFGAIVLPDLMKVEAKDLKPPIEKPSEGFYLAVEPASLADATNAQVAYLQLSPNPVDWRQTVADAMQVQASRRIPMIVWDLAATDTTQNWPANTYEAVAAGDWDSLLISVLAPLNRIGTPVYVLFAPEADRNRGAWTAQNSNLQGYYKAAWHHLAEMWEKAGWYNVVWFEHMKGTETLGRYRLNMGDPAAFVMTGPVGGDLREFDRRLQRYRNIRAMDPQWLMMPSVTPDLLDSLEQAIPDLQGILLTEPLSGEVMVNTLLRRRDLAPVPPTIARAEAQDQMAEQLSVMKTGNTTGGVRIGQTADGGFSLLIEGEPFYIQGLAYNPAHDWRDGFYPLTRNVLEEDMKKIKMLGANTIRRYSSGIYDHNLLRVSAEHGMHVIYGFWFDPKVDYYRDSSQVDDYVDEVVDRVLELKGNPAILAWGIGNETWGLLKHYHRKTYLPSVRMAYLHMIERIAARVKELDPDHPVFAALEHSADLGVGLSAYHDQVPSLDFISVNSYYDAQIRQLDSLCSVHYPGKPYLVSEFGPEGYWDERFTSFNSYGRSLEPSSYEKAQSYITNWQDYIKPNAGRNLGGIAFCWRDRMEETITWFGLTDDKGRIRPAYRALQSVWGGYETFEFPVPDVYLPQAPYPFEKFTFRGVTGEPLDSTAFEVEWVVRKDHILDPVESIVATGTLSSELDLDDLEPGHEYRVYVTITDSTGKYSTSASLPFYNP